MTAKLSFTCFGYAYTRFCSATKSIKQSLLSNPLKFCAVLMFFFSCGMAKLHGKSNPIRADDSGEFISQNSENDTLTHNAKKQSKTSIKTPIKEGVDVWRFIYDLLFEYAKTVLGLLFSGFVWLFRKII